jgi:hypothetical protein
MTPTTEEQVKRYWRQTIGCMGYSRCCRKLRAGRYCSCVQRMDSATSPQVLSVSIFQHKMSASAKGNAKEQPTSFTNRL